MESGFTSPASRYNNTKYYNSPTSRHVHYLTVRRGLEVRATGFPASIDAVRTYFKSKDHTRVDIKSVFSWYSNDKEDVTFNSEAELLEYAKAKSPGATIRWSDSFQDCNAMLTMVGDDTFYLVALTDIASGDEIVLFNPVQLAARLSVTTKRKIEQTSPKKISPPSKTPKTNESENVTRSIQRRFISLSPKKDTESIEAPESESLDDSQKDTPPKRYRSVFKDEEKTATEVANRMMEKFTPPPSPFDNVESSPESPFRLSRTPSPQESQQFNFVRPLVRPSPMTPLSPIREPGTPTPSPPSPTLSLSPIEIDHTAQAIPEEIPESRIESVATDTGIAPRESPEQQRVRMLNIPVINVDESEEEVEDFQMTPWQQECTEEQLNSWAETQRQVLRDEGIIKQDKEREEREEQESPGLPSPDTVKVSAALNPIAVDEDEEDNQQVEEVLHQASPEVKAKYEKSLERIAEEGSPDDFEDVSGQQEVEVEEGSIVSLNVTRAKEESSKYVYEVMGPDRFTTIEELFEHQGYPLTAPVTPLGKVALKEKLVEQKPVSPPKKPEVTLQEKIAIVTAVTERETVKPVSPPKKLIQDEPSLGFAPSVDALIKKVSVVTSPGAPKNKYMDLPAGRKLVATASIKNGDPVICMPRESLIADSKEIDIKNAVRSMFTDLHESQMPFGDVYIETAVGRKKTFYLDAQINLKNLASSKSHWYAMNHSINPNTKMKVREDNVYWIAVRDIQPGEEITYNYGVVPAEWNKKKPENVSRRLMFTEKEAERHEGRMALSEKTIEQERIEAEAEKKTMLELRQVKVKQVQENRKSSRQSRKPMEGDLASYRLKMQQKLVPVNLVPSESGARIMLDLKDIKERNQLICAIRESNKNLESSGNSSYQTLTFANIQKLLACLVSVFKMNKYSRFIDLGSGYGNIVFQAALTWELQAAHGIDIGLQGMAYHQGNDLIIPLDKILYYCSILTKQIVASKVPQVKEQMDKVMFYFGDVSTCSLEDYTHLISFNTLWDAGDFHGVIGQLMNPKSKMVVFGSTKDLFELKPRLVTGSVSVTDVEADKMMIGKLNDNFEMVQKISLPGSGAGRTFTMYFYVKASESYQIPVDLFESTYDELRMKIAKKDVPLADNFHMFSLSPNAQSQKQESTFSPSSARHRPNQHRESSGKNRRRRDHLDETECIVS
jgi:hypothetical protein